MVVSHTNGGSAGAGGQSHSLSAWCWLLPPTLHLCVALPAVADMLVSQLPACWSICTLDLCVLPARGQSWQDSDIQSCEYAFTAPAYLSPVLSGKMVLLSCSLCIQSVQWCDAFVSDRAWACHDPAWAFDGNHAATFPCQQPSRLTAALKHLCVLAVFGCGLCGSVYGGRAPLRR